MARITSSKNFNPYVSVFVYFLSLESYVMTDGQPASLSWNKAPIWSLRLDLYYCLTVAGLLFWGALSNERPGLSFTNSVGLRQRSHFLVRVPWDSLPYFTVSVSRLPFSSPPTTRRGTVEVFDPASTRGCIFSVLKKMPSPCNVFKGVLLLLQIKEKL
jgi:hypothetical protein